MMRIKSLVFLSTFIVLSFTFLFVPFARAESTDHVSKLSISIWPEYDDPTVLVQYDGEFTSNSNFPRSVSFYVPTGAKVIATAYVDDSGNYVNTDPWTVQDSGSGYSNLTFKLPSAHFHAEFYYNPLQGAPDKTMDFVYKAAQATDAIHVEVQQPLKSENFKTVPAGTIQTNPTHGFSYSLLDFPALDADKTLDVQVTYTKSDPNPSVDFITTANATPSPPGSDATAVASSSNLIVPTVLVSVGLAIGALGFYYWYSRRQTETQRVSARAGGKRARRNAQASHSAYCWQCGHGLEEDDNFCANCGAQRRK